MNQKKYKLFIISGPSCCGKSTLIKHILHIHSNILPHISYTTRAQRPEEQNGKDYHFITKQEFKQKIENNEFLEYAVICDNLYGTHKASIKNMLTESYSIIDIDYQGLQSIQNEKLLNDDEYCSIFIMPENTEVLKSRLSQRENISNKDIETRIAQGKIDMQHMNIYKYVLYNKDIQDTLKEINTIIQKEIS